MQGLARSKRLSGICLGGLLLSLGFAACNTNAVAVQECRDIESARCEASVPCGVIEKEEVESCKRFYKDQCLHGISGPELPTADEQRLCIELIDRAGEEAEDNIGIGGAHALACEVVSRPWDLPACEFLLPEEDDGGDGDGDGDGDDDDDDDDDDE